MFHSAHSLILFLNFFGDKLSANKILVDTTKIDKLLVSAALLDLSMLHADDLISIADRAQSVGDNDDSLLPTAYQFIKGLLDLVLTLGIEG